MGLAGVLTKHGAVRGVGPRVQGKVGRWQLAALVASSQAGAAAVCVKAHCVCPHRQRFLQQGAWRCQK